MRVSFLILAAVLTTQCGAVRAAADQCFANAAARRHVNVNLLYAMAHVESRFNPAATNDKTGAMGEMQIHPSHLKWLSKYGISERDLYDECTNINVGAFLLSDFIRMYGNTWRAVGAYGAGNARDKEAARNGYAQLVQAEYLRITREPRGHATDSTKSPTPAANQRARLGGRPMMVVD